MTINAVDLFTDKFASLSGKPHVVSRADEIGDLVKELVEQRNSQTIAMGELRPDIAAAIREKCFGIRILAPPYHGNDLPNLIDQADIGITSAQFAIAETGTLIEIVTNDALRLVSSLPRVYVGIVESKNILPTYQESAAIVRKAFFDQPRECVVSFISGPSRTGDIELKLTLGVHGPGEAHAVVVDG